MAYKVYASEQFVEEKLANIKIPEQVQVDFNQNDETAPDYIKNRTHGEIITEGEFVIFDENEVDFTYDRISKSWSSSDEIQVDTEKFIVGQSYTVVLDGTIYENLVCYEETDRWGTYLVIGAPHSKLGYVDQWDEYPLSVTLQNNTICIYIPDTSRKDSVHSVKVSTIGRTVTVKQLDEKYIPDTIARKSDLSTLVTRIAQLESALGTNITELANLVGGDA